MATDGTSPGSPKRGPFEATKLWRSIIGYFRSEMPLKRHWQQLSFVDQSFTGAEAVDFLLKTLPEKFPERYKDKSIDRSNCVQLLNFFMNEKVFHEVKRATQTNSGFKDGNVIYTFTSPKKEETKNEPTKRKIRRSSSCKNRRATSVVLVEDIKADGFGMRLEDIDAFAMQAVPNTRRLSRSLGNLECHTNQAFSDELSYPSSSSSSGAYLKAKKAKHASTKKLDRVEEKDEKEGFYDWLPFQKKRGSAKPKEKAKEDLKKVARRSRSLDRNLFSRLSTRQPSSSTLSAASDEGVARAPLDAQQVEVLQSSPTAGVSSRRARTYERRGRIKPSPQKGHEVTAWKDILLQKFDEATGPMENDRWKGSVNARDVHWNANCVGHSGVVRPRIDSERRVYPSSVINLMEFLEEFPFHMQKATVVKYTEGQEVRIFKTVCHRLREHMPGINLNEKAAIVELLARCGDFRVMLLARKRCEVSPRMSTSRTETVFGSRISDYAYGNVDRKDEGNDSALHYGLVVRPNGLGEGVQVAFPVSGSEFEPKAQQSQPRAMVTINRMSRTAGETSDYHTGSLGVFPLVFEEGDYELPEGPIKEALALLLLSLPTIRRRRLHKFVRFMRCLATNHCLQLEGTLAGVENNWQAVLRGMHLGVCERVDASVEDEAKSVLVAAVLLANERVLFAVPGAYADCIRRRLNLSPEFRVDERSTYGTLEPLKSNARKHTQNGEADVDGRLTDNEKRKNLKKLKKVFPETYECMRPETNQSKPGLISRIFKK